MVQTQEQKKVGKVEKAEQVQEEFPIQHMVSVVHSIGNDLKDAFSHSDSDLPQISRKKTTDLPAKSTA